MITIRKGTEKDISSIMRFIDEYWQAGNPLAVNEKFFRWQFLDEEGLNVFIAIDEETGKIYGTLGQIKYSKEPIPDVAGCIWKAIKSSNPLLGVELARYAYDPSRSRFEISPCLSDTAIKVTGFLGNPTTTMVQHYRINPDMEYKICIIENKVVPEIEDYGYSLDRIETCEEMKKTVPESVLKKTIPCKDYYYINWRYFEHPIYHYDFFRIANKHGDSKAVLVMREEEYNTHKMIKLLNIYGDESEFAFITAPLDRLMKEREYEYATIYSYGVSEGIFEKAGFLKVDEETHNILPIHFHPYEKKNIVLKMEDFGLPGEKVFLSDGDQDRPC